MTYYYCPNSSQTFNIRSGDLTNPLYSKLYVKCQVCGTYHSVLELRTIAQFLKQRENQYINKPHNCFHQRRKTISEIGELLQEHCLQCGQGITHPNIRTTKYH